LMPLRDELPNFDFYFNLGELYRLTDKPDNSRLYFDSARIILESVVRASPDDYHVQAKLGVAYALVGDYDKAAQAGRRAKDLLSVDDCHW
jgi:tetratricopeptide (TPR) repeat protein